MKSAKYIIIALGIPVIAYFSVYFEPLDKTQSLARQGAFDPSEYVHQFWDNLVQKKLSDAVDAAVLLDLFEKDMQQAVSKYAHTLGIASTHAYLIRGTGRIIGMSDEGVEVSLAPNGETADILIKTSYIFGNAVRDASGLVHVSDFPSTMEFNNISVEINKIVKEQVIPPFLEQAKIGRVVDFIGATEVSEDSPEIHPLAIIPIQVTVHE